MTTQVYKSYKNIINFIKGKHLLNAQLCIPTNKHIYIPITNIKFNTPRARRGRMSNMSIKYETFDKNSGQLSIDQYNTLLNYINILTKANKGNYLIKKHLNPLTTKYDVNYIKCSMQFPIRMIKQTFIINKNVFYICKFIGINHQAIYLLLSPTLNASWVTKFSAENFSLTKANLTNINKLMKYHLINNILAFYINTSATFSMQLINSYSINNVDNKFRLFYPTGNITFNLKKIKAQFIETDKFSPALKVTTLNNQITYYLIFAPTINHKLLSRLIN